MGAHARIGNVLEQPKAGKVYAANANSARIVDVFNLATEAEIVAGLNWYNEAQELAAKISPKDPKMGAGVIAALSPMMPWDRNMMLAEQAFTDGKASGALFGNVAKANRIMAGENPLDVLGGDKVRNFYLAIAEPATSEAVCIDRHAFDIAVGRVTNNESRAVLKNKGVYESFAKAYVRAAKVASKALGQAVTPSQMQAITWTTWRRLKGL